MPNVSFVHPAVRKLLPQYELIRDCLAGEKQIKFRRAKYLPIPNASDTSVENAERYNAYITRAVFYNVAQRTQGGLVGQIFMRHPVVEVPADLQSVVDDATGSGVPLEQLAAEAASFVIAYGRCGVYVDYPSTEEATSVAALENGDIRPVVQVVAPWDCINYRVKKRGAKIILSLVVFREDYTDEDDGFETVIKDQYRVLRLTKDDVYVIEIYRNKMGGTPYQSFTPKDADGKTLSEIAFTFIGVQNNDSVPSIPPMYDLCALNIAHYRNSADYEENVYFLGQPTPWYSGLTEEWVTKVMGGVVAFGARGGIMLPENGQAGVLQVQPNTLAKEAMDQKESQMIALGAKLVESSGAAVTATEASIDNISETSILSSVAKNVASAILWALQWGAVFTGSAESSVKYSMNTEFDLTHMDANERAQLLAELQGNGISFSEYRTNMRRAGIATLSDEDAKTEIDKDMASQLAAAVTEAEALNIAPPVDPNKPDPNKPADPAAKNAPAGTKPTK